MLSVRPALRRLRYALPGVIERRVSGPGPADVVERCQRLHRRGHAAAIGYFQAGDADPATIVAAYTAVARLLAARTGPTYLSVKAPPLSFDPASLRVLAEAGAASGAALLFDAHAPAQADCTLAAAVELLRDFPGTGVAIPARWRRSRADAAEFRETSARIRLVKGEWADGAGDEPDAAASYLELVALLAGRAAPVAVATHDPQLAERALERLLEAGTPCELEQLRGLPARRTLAVARRLGVPVRIYLPFGPGWWSYAFDKALARPYLPAWMLADWTGVGAPVRKSR